MADDKQDDSFRVVDRRLFTSEGELRREVLEEERHEEEKKPAAAPKSAKEVPAPAKAAPAPKEEATAQAPSQPEDSRSFQMLVDLLARNAVALLGGMQDPQTGRAYVDIEGAREVIDMMDTLREKTRGNLAKTEEELLSEVLAGLKLTYMEISQAAAKAMREGAKGKPK